MVLCPEVQRKAQEELDSELQGALPTLEDRERLPYTTALVKEVFRWHPVTTLGAHFRDVSCAVSNADDVLSYSPCPDGG